MTEGRKDDKGKLPWHLLAPESLIGIVRVLQFGAKKYAERNWERGMAWSRLFGALMRHMWAWWSGESIDPETGYSHLDHAACCIHFLQAYEVRHVGEDDRPIKKTQPSEDGWADCAAPLSIEDYVLLANIKDASTESVPDPTGDSTLCHPNWMKQETLSPATSPLSNTQSQPGPASKRSPLPF